MSWGIYILYRVILTDSARLLVQLPMVQTLFHFCSGYRHHWCGAIFAGIKAPHHKFSYDSQCDGGCVLKIANSPLPILTSGCSTTAPYHLIDAHVGLIWPVECSVSFLHLFICLKRAALSYPCSTCNTVWY